VRAIYLAVLPIVACLSATAASSDVFLPTATEPYFVASGDLNGDGYPDLVLPCRGELLSPEKKRPANDTATIYLTEGSPELVQRKDVTVGFGPYTAAIGDLDGDGLPDVVVTNFQSNDQRDLSILYGSKDRSQAVDSAVSIAVGPPHSPYKNLLTAEGKPPYATPGLTSVAIADFNHDGKPDLVVVAWSVDAFVVLLNEGNRKFRQLTYPLPAGPRDVAVGDFNQDGNFDLAFTLYSINEIQVWTGDGSGKMKVWQTFLSHGSTPYHLKAADVDRDGRLDLVVGNRGPSDNVAVFRNLGAKFQFIGSYKPGTPKKGETTADEIRDVLVTDWNGDGIPDLVAACHISSKVVVWEGTADPAFGKTFVHRAQVVYESKGPRSIIPFGNGLAVAMFDSNELGLIDPRLIVVSKK
jgi:hypothetical protein